MKPTIHLTNWSTHRTLHGPGRKWSIMARPREWERGDGTIVAATPHPDDLAAVRSGQIDADEYRRRCEARWDRWLAGYVPGVLKPWPKQGDTVVQDGDTLCCACAVGKPCHRLWLAPYLARAGWRVILDGAEWRDLRATVEEHPTVRRLVSVLEGRIEEVHGPE